MADIKHEILKAYTHLLSTFPLVGEDVKAGVMGEFIKRK